MTNESPGFNGFCGDYFFDYNATINADSPTLSKCFEHTVLTWVPVLCLLCMLPFQILFCIKSKALPLLSTTLLLAKYVIQMCLVLVTLVHWIYCVFTKYMNNSTIISADDFVAPLLINFSMILLFGIIISCRFKGLVTSGVFFISIFLFLLCGIPEFLTQINTISRQSDVEYEMPASCFIIYFCLLFIQWILSFFADKPAYYRSVGSAEKVCPEKLSSFFNRISFWWFSSMTVTGWKRSLTRDDLWLLNEEDSSEELVKNWEKLWLPRLRRFFQRKAATSKNATPDDSAKMENIQDGKVAFIDRQQQQPLTESSKKKNAKASTADNYPSLIWCLFLAYFHLIVPASILKTIADTIQFINPILLSLMIQFISTPEEPVWKGYFFALAMFFTSVLYTFLLHQYFHYMMRFGMNMRTVLVSSVFNKALKLSNSARKEKGTGETVNIMSTDVQRFQDAAFYVNLVISCPYQIIIAIYFLWKQLGPSVLAGVGVMVLLIPINYVLSMFQRKLQVQQMKMKDDRIKLMNEILNGIKVLKLYAWEDSFEKQILQIRSKELSVLRKMNYLSAVTTLLWSCAPFLVSVVSFGVYILSTNNSFTPQTAFVSLSLFNILRFPMTMFPMLVSYAVQASVSNKRLKEFLCSGEMDPTNVDRSMRGENAVKVENGTFSWGTAPKTVPTLHDLNCTVEKGKLVAVVGQVGSGKSSLLSAILGEMDKNDGYVGLNGSIAYIPQQAWIQNMTLKDNVTFGKPLSDKSYAEVIDSCALAADLEILPSGDMTEIGEKGINLSGGQKQRVSLARAVYQNSDIYLFDDPLSAVDSHVGRHIFDKVISNDGMLKDKTRILVTHGLGYLKNVDKIFVMTNGRITESGTYRELLSKRGAFAEILVTYLKEKEEGEVEDEEEDLEIGEVLHDLEEADPSVLERLASELEPEEDLSHSPKRLLNRLLSSKEDFESGRKSPPKKQSSIEPPFGKRQVSVKETPTKQAQFDKKKEDSKIIKEESTETGRVKMTVYNSYFKAMGYGAFVGCVLLTALSNIFGASSNLWLSRWSNQNDSLGTVNNDFYLGIYASLGLSQAIFIFLAALLMTFATMAASKILHKNLLENLLRSPLTFYDITPLGRILNRCGKDVDVVDNTLANTIRSWIGCICNVFFTIITIIVAIYYFAIVVLPLTIMYFFALRFYVSTSRQLKRLESVSRSPIFSQFQETLNGASSIRAYCVQEKFVKDSERRVDENQACYYPNIVSNRWIAVRLEFIGNLMVLFAAIFGVLGRDTFNGGQVGLALSYSLSVTQVLNWAVRMTSDLETNIVAVERIKEYSETPTEAPWVTETRPQSGWPTVGSFTVDRFSLRYRKNLDLVLKEITCTIRGGEKVGIVGRTGAGKSSLTLALFRIVEPAGGKILIDDVDITKIGLHDLRSRLTIIPQDPVLFSGTLRMNLDPFEKHSDDEIWTALEQAHLKHFVSEQTEKLFHKISEGGENLSVGQRQLICLARALLRKTKVLVLDEATAAVDLETDDLIQKTIRSYFSDCTIITIAHRLNTIMDSNRVMVLSAGNIVEFESPEKLLNDPNSNFYSMAKDAGLV